MIHSMTGTTIRDLIHHVMHQRNATYRNTTKILFLATIILLLPATGSRACTIFFIASDGMVLAGNNEDWEDPAPRFWIYPPGNGKHGWIKFGFGSGFPQGGMNDCGLFWDATAGPYMAMPHAEAYKTLYHGPLMQKIIEECSCTADALGLFNAYYCEDQYKAQYLVGDSTGNSMIVEGDSVLHKDKYYQVLTNFYQSNPDLGGYPCWRYDKAMELLGQCETVTPYYAGIVLASTHQEGRYPTQYSNIYDLRNRVVYLFYFHNYEEYLVIDLKEAMEQGASSWDIPLLFSQVSLPGPADRDTLPAGPVTIHWLGLKESTYSVVYSENADLSDSRSVEPDHREEGKDNQASLPLMRLFPLIIPLTILTGKKRSIPLMQLFLIAVMVVISSCEREDEPEEKEKPVEFSVTLENLEPGTCYYWKIVACADPSGSWSTETSVRTFMTSNE
jgi:hypothetical protein